MPATDTQTDKARKSFDRLGEEVSPALVLGDRNTEAPQGGCLSRSLELAAGVGGGAALGK